MHERTSLCISRPKYQYSAFWFAPPHMDFYPKVCRIVSTAAPEVVSFKADENLKPGEVEWANYIKVRTMADERHLECAR